MCTWCEDLKSLTTVSGIGDDKSLTAVSDSELNEQMLLIEIRQPMADEFNWSDFIAIGFCHHIEIITLITRHFVTLHHQKYLH